MSPNPHRLARKLIKNNLPQGIGYTLLAILARLIALAPLVLALEGYHPIEPPIVSIVIGFVITCILYLLLVVPPRMAYRRYFATKAASRRARVQLLWGKAIGLQIRRTLRTFLFHLPFIVALFMLYHDLKLSDALTPLKRMKTLGKIPSEVLGLSSTLIPGAVVMVLIFFVCALISYLGNNKYIFLDMLSPLSKNPFQEAKRLKKKNKAALQRAKRGNFLLSLPFTIVALYFLGADIVSTLKGDLISDLLTVMITLLNLDFSATALYGVLGAFVLLYLPLYPLRKVALCCAAVE